MSWTLLRLGEVHLFSWVDGPTVVGEAKSGKKIFTGKIWSIVHLSDMKRHEIFRFFL
jgi:hypothetical protein